MPGRPLLPSDLYHFITVLRSQSRSKSNQSLKIGICVSGGPDSMALAYLLQQLKCHEASWLELSGWIVDHKARPESTIEARSVSENLTKIGIHSTILNMTWPDSVRPLELSNFESQARTKRYDLLAHAAKAHNIQHLALGHHMDDQVETVIMRLVRNQNITLTGLAGMAASSAIPAAFRNFGVHVEDGGIVQRDGIQPAVTQRPLVLDTRLPERSADIRFTVNGGIRLERPLLAFRKADLVETCKVNKVPYVIDPTNKNPHTTLRNAVRHLRSEHRLPEALTGTRLLALQRSAQNYLSRMKANGETILSTCDILKLELRSGTLQVRIPYMTCHTSVDIEACSYAISKLIEMVTPTVRVNRSTQIPAHILSHFSNLNSIEQSSLQWPPRPFSIDGVQLTPDTSCPHRWTFSRQPMRASEIEKNTTGFVTGFKHDNTRNQISDCLLWDNRYWIRLHFSESRVLRDVIIRPLRVDDMTIIKQQAISRLWPRKDEAKRLLQSIDEAAPGQTRFTLPVLTMKDRIIALPTLQQKPTGMFTETNLGIHGWDVFYNTIGLAKEQHK